MMKSENGVGWAIWALLMEGCVGEGGKEVASAVVMQLLKKR